RCPFIFKRERDSPVFHSNCHDSVIILHVSRTCKFIFRSDRDFRLPFFKESLSRESKAQVIQIDRMSEMSPGSGILIFAVLQYGAVLCQHHSANVRDRVNRTWGNWTYAVSIQQSTFDQTTNAPVEGGALQLTAVQKHELAQLIMSHKPRVQHL